LAGEDFSEGGGVLAWALGETESTVLPENTALVVCERGRDDLCETFCEVDIRSGDEGEEAFGEATCDEVVDDAVDMV
jgi:hypothetical protein